MKKNGEVQLLNSIPSIRPIMDQITDKWSIMVLVCLCPQAQRFNAIKRSLPEVTQKALTQTLRRLERNGFVQRYVRDASPVAVEYSLTALGRSFSEPFGFLYSWAVQHRPQIENAQKTFDEKARRQV